MLLSVKHVHVVTFQRAKLLVFHATQVSIQPTVCSANSAHQACFLFLAHVNAMAAQLAHILTVVHARNVRQIPSLVMGNQAVLCVLTEQFLVIL